MLKPTIPTDRADFTDIFFLNELPTYRHVCLAIERVTSLKILGVTITDKLSVSVHVADVVRKCAQSLHVIRVLRRHGMNDQALQAIYRSVILAELLLLLCASSAWWGFTTADDRHPSKLSLVVESGWSVPG